MVGSCSLAKTSLLNVSIVPKPTNPRSAQGRIYSRPRAADATDAMGGRLRLHQSTPSLRARSFASSAGCQEVHQSVMQLA